ncbi:phage tail protein [Anaerobacillus sp. MEB173]|uniref:phage tail-collar fiber domain-containing protein n=1 Tax=Anaerobacillus sp. MEB173 TaxID=3383345 RepID=UPI003F90DAC7
MSAFGGLTLTNRGKTLQSKAQTGVQLNYTRIALGDGELGSSSILELNALKNEKKSLPITKLKIMSGGRAVIGTVLSNQEMNSGFYWREIGVFAQDPDAGEILYCYANAGALAEYIPAGDGSDIIEKSIDVQTLVGNAVNVTATIDSSLLYVTEAELQEVDNKVTTHLADDIQHITSEERTTWNAKETTDGTRKKVEQTDYKVYKSSKDSEGIFTMVEYRRNDNTLAIKSVLSGGTSPQYTTRTITYYGLNGTTIEKTSTRTLTYDADGVLVSEV